MKLLLDTCVWGGARTTLTAAGHDVIWAGDWSEDPGDEAILARASGERRVLVTLDRTSASWPSSGAHSTRASCVGLAARDQAAACVQVLARHGGLLEAGAIVTVEPGRIRVRPPEGA